MKTDKQLISHAYYLDCVSKAKKLSQFIEKHCIDDIFGSATYLPVNILIFIAACYRMSSNNQSFSTAKAATITDCYPE